MVEYQHVVDAVKRLQGAGERVTLDGVRRMLGAGSRGGGGRATR